MRHELKIAESESNDIVARADCKKADVTDCGQLSNELENWAMEREEAGAETREVLPKGGLVCIAGSVGEGETLVWEFVDGFRAEGRRLFEAGQAKYRLFGGRIRHGQVGAGKLSVRFLPFLK